MLELIRDSEAGARAEGRGVEDRVVCEVRAAIDAIDGDGGTSTGTAAEDLAEDKLFDLVNRSLPFTKAVSLLCWCFSFCLGLR